MASSASPDLSAPLVSVVTPVWNAAATLAETVASVRAQSLADWELLLVDDASTDGSRDLARALAAADPRIRLIERATNGGAAAARNDGDPRRPRPADRLPRRRRPLAPGEARPPDRLHGGASGHAFVYSGYRRVAADGTPLGVVRPPARVSRDRAARAATSSAA